jgi:plasmid stabilization system protein ParE
MSYRLRPTPQAEADIERLYASLVERRGEDAARQWYESYTGAVERLLTMPLSCALAYENPRFAQELRHLLFGIPPKRKYRALFTIRGAEVVILAIRAPGEKPVRPEDIPPEG